MKRVLTLILTLVMIVSLCACGGETGEKESGKDAEKEPTFDTLAVGVSRQDITPDHPIGAHINGGGDPNRLAEGILDNLTITCIAVTDKGNNTVLFYSQDIHNPVGSWTTTYRQNISDATGVPVERIFMTATHTHSSLMPTDGTNANNEEFTAKYEAAIITAAQEALADRAPAQMYCSEVDVKEANNGQAMAFVRHVTMLDGSVTGSNFGTYNFAMLSGFPYEADNEAQLIKFVREGKDGVLMMNWPAHSTFHGTTALRNISADYPAYVRGYIEENTDYTFAIFLSGAGDQVPQSKLYPKVDHHLECDAYGAALGKIITDYMADDANFRQVEDGVIKQQNKVVTVATNKISDEQMALALKAKDVYNYFLENGQAEGNTYAIANGFQSCYEARSFVSRMNLEDTMDIPLDVMTLGNMAFAITRYEISGGSSKAIKDAFKNGDDYTMAFIVGYCNDNLGYIPNELNYEYNNGRGSYEAYDCKYAKGTCEQLTDTYIQMIKDMKAN